MTTKSLPVALDALELYPVRVPMRHRFRGVDHREAVLIRGPSGWGEFSPFREYSTAVAARWLSAGVEAACATPPPIRRSRIPVNVTVPAVDPTTAEQIVTGSGASTAKVKVAEPGQSESDDLARLESVRRALGDDGKIRIDANGAWDVETAVKCIGRLARFGLEYVEQPVTSVDDMVRVRQKIEIPVAADESARLADDPLEIVTAGGADVLVLKVQPMGGVDRILDLAARAGVPVVLSSALETSVGMAMGLIAAAALEDLPFACGLGTVALLAGDVVREPLIAHDGALTVRRPEPDFDLIERHRPDAETADEMLSRLRAAAEMLT